ncbi:ERCC4 domain-containing protein [Psidium guajava]|nr:ERCC4 domain-containing protein [Psidium guajava]
MVDHLAVCCMCGDVGFPEKIFHCNRCRNRYQHSYCNNFYSESLEPIEQCDWCQSEFRSSSRHSSSSSQKLAARSDSSVMKSEYSAGEKIKQQHRDDGPAPVPVEKGSASSSRMSSVSERRSNLRTSIICYVHYYPLMSVLIVFLFLKRMITRFCLGGYMG